MKSILLTVLLFLGIGLSGLIAEICYEEINVTATFHPNGGCTADPDDCYGTYTVPVLCLDNKRPNEQ